VFVAPEGSTAAWLAAPQRQWSPLSSASAFGITRRICLASRAGIDQDEVIG
jgi:hypothetical protein